MPSEGNARTTYDINDISRAAHGGNVNGAMKERSQRGSGKAIEPAQSLPQRVKTRGRLAGDLPRLPGPSILVQAFAPSSLVR